MTEEHAKKNPRTHETPRKGHSVMLYLAILFAAAFLLLLLSYFMQQRTSQEAITGLKESISSMQSMETMMQHNSDLQKELDKKDDKIAALVEEKNDLELALVQTKAELAAARKLLDEVHVAP